jgi:predicted nucleic acid-binding protein
MRYLLDSNIIFDFIRNPKGSVASRIRRVGKTGCFTSVIVAAELRFGVAKKHPSNSKDALKKLFKLSWLSPLTRQRILLTE